MSSPEGPFARFHQMAHKMLRNGGVYRIDDAFRKKYGLGAVVDDARRAARGLSPGEEARISKALDDLTDAVKSADAEGTRQYRVGLAVGLTGLGLGVLGIVISLLIAGCSGA